MPEEQSKGIRLTEAERIAKEKFLLFFREAYHVPCDTGTEDFDILPSWYDEVKYKRGQKYFQDNRLGIFNSNLIGLICLLAEPRGLKILASTGRSSTKETARRRYVSTVLHTLSWYEVDLSPGSQSRKSLAAVRKMHLLAAKSAEEKKIGRIMQSELALTAFGFMGFPLVRPHLLGIRHDNEEDREAFIHVWAVLCHMIGVKEKYNICLLPMEPLKVLCLMMMRYILLPIIQIETPLFKEMTTAMLDGMSDFLPHMDYGAQMFTARLLLSVPGYQYDIDTSKEELCRSILNQQDVDELNTIVMEIIGLEHAPLSVDIPVIEIFKIEKYTEVNQNEVKRNSIEQHLHEIMNLSPTEHLTIRYVNYEEEWQSCLNGSKFHELSSQSQSIVKIRRFGRTLYEYSFSRYLIECLISLVLNKMRKKGHHA